MSVDEVVKYCYEKPNGTYDLVAYVNAHDRTVFFEWGNSLLLKLDQEVNKLSEIVGRKFTDVHPQRIKDLMIIPSTRVIERPPDEESEK